MSDCVPVCRVCACLIVFECVSVRVCCVYMSDCVTVCLQFKLQRKDEDPHVRLEGRHCDDWKCIDFGVFLLSVTREQCWGGHITVTWVTGSDHCF